MVDNVTSLLSHDASAPAEVQAFSAAPTKGTAPMDVVFTLTTNKAAMGVRVVDASGNPLTAVSYTHLVLPLGQHHQLPQPAGVLHHHAAVHKGQVVPLSLIHI